MDFREFNPKMEFEKEVIRDRRFLYIQQWSWDLNTVIKYAK